MKTIRIGLTSLIIGLLLGLTMGINIGREKPLFSNPFNKESLVDRAKQLGHDTLEQTVQQSGKALEKAGQALQDKAK
jgi:hypothetical protein